MQVLTKDGYHELNRWHNKYICPGPVGSVGDTLLSVELKSSLPGDYRQLKMTEGKKESRFGTNLTDGDFKSWETGFGSARVNDSHWQGRRRFKTAVGWKYEDLRAEDRSVTAVLAAMPQYSWRTQVARTVRATMPGELFPIPKEGMISPPEGGLNRGGNFPTVVASEKGSRSMSESVVGGGTGATYAAYQEGAPNSRGTKTATTAAGGGYYY